MTRRTSKEVAGKFTVLGGILVALYRFESALYLRIGEKCIPVDGDLTAEVRGNRATNLLIAERAKLDRTLIVTKGGQEIARLDYIYDLSNQFPDDPTPFVEQEDFDFGLWISNITKSPERQRVLLGLD